MLDAKNLVALRFWHLMLEGTNFIALKKATILLIVTAIMGLFLALSTSGTLVAPRGSGKIHAIDIGVYLNSRCTISCTTINWRNINPSTATTKMVYIKNQVLLQ